jgi:hypothetical protein
MESELAALRLSAVCLQGFGCRAKDEVADLVFLQVAGLGKMNMISDGVLVGHAAWLVDWQQVHPCGWGLLDQNLPAMVRCCVRRRWLDDG